MVLTGFLSQLVSRMTEGPREEEMEQRLKRPLEEEEDQGGKRRKEEEDQGLKGRKDEGEGRDNDRKYPKKKVALLMAYSGKGYYGMQVLQDLSLSTPPLVFFTSPT